MAEHRWSKWWWQDWQRDPALRMCSPAARGVWMDMMAIMFDAEPHGHLLVNGRVPSTRQLSSVFGCSEKEASGYIKELEDSGALSRSEDGIIFCRRMVRDKAISQKASALGEQGGNPEIRRGTVPKDERVRPYKRSDSPAKTARIFSKRGGCCWWCDRTLQTIEPGPDFFHVDHLLPVCDGGTNDEDNLVPSCAECNHDRARVNPTITENSIRHQGGGYCRNGTDPKHQEAESESEAEEPPVTPLGPKSSVAASRGSRLTDDWEPDRDFASALGLDAATVLAGFRDYWRSAPGAKGRKADWQATWRNWCRKEAERLPLTKPSRAAESRQKLQRYLADIAETEAETEPRTLLQ